MDLKEIKGPSAQRVGDTRRYFTACTHDEAAKEVLGEVQRRWEAIAASLSYGSKGITFAFGFDADPQGTAGWRTKGGAFLNGQQVYFNAQDWGRNDEDFQNGVALEMQRMLLAAARAVSAGGMKDALGGFDIANASTEKIQEAMANVRGRQQSPRPKKHVKAAPKPDSLDLEKLISESSERAATKLVASLSPGWEKAEKERLGDDLEMRAVIFDDLKNALTCVAFGGAGGAMMLKGGDFYVALGAIVVLMSFFLLCWSSSITTRKMGLIIPFKRKLIRRVYRAMWLLYIPIIWAVWIFLINKAP